MENDSQSEKRNAGITAERGVNLSRRAVIIGGAGLLASVALSGCRDTATQQQGANNGNTNPGGAATPQRAAREFSLEARPTEVEIAPGRRAAAWTYDGRLPGTELRVKEGERLRVSIKNNLPEATSIHWHGLPLRGANNMDGVPFLTQPPV